MIIQVKLVKECPKGEFGTCEIINKNKIVIEVSEKKNRDRYQFFVTLLHEMLHAWMFVLKANDIVIPVKKEHKWIYSVQAVVIKALELIENKNAKN